MSDLPSPVSELVVQPELVPAPCAAASRCRFCGRRLTDPVYAARRAGRVCGGPAHGRRLTLTPPAHHAGLDHEVPVIDGQLDLFDPTIPATSGTNQMEEPMRNLADEIRDEIDREHMDAVSHGCSTGPAEALRAVINLHVPNSRGNCSNRCYTAGMAPAPYPCLTAQLIAEELGMAVETEATQ